MTAGAGSEGGIEPVGEVTADNARAMLAEQLGAVAQLGRDFAGDDDDWIPPFDDTSAAAYAFLGQEERKAGRAAGQGHGRDPCHRREHGEDRRQAAGGRLLDSASWLSLGS